MERETDIRVFGRIWGRRDRERGLSHSSGFLSPGFVVFGVEGRLCINESVSLSLFLSLRVSCVCSVCCV